MMNAAKVGVLVVVFVVLAIASFAVLGHSLLPSEGKPYFVSMTDAGGLTQGTRVLMAGVQIGTVDKVELHGPYLARLTLKIHPDVHIPLGSYAQIPGSLIGLGDNPLTIVPPEQERGELEPGATMIGRKASPLEALLPDGGKQLYNQTNKTLAAVQKLLADSNLQKNLSNLMVTANETLKASQASLARFNMLADHANSLITRNEGSLDAMVQSTRQTIASVRDTAGALAKFAQSGKLQNGTSALLEKAAKIEDEANHLLAKLDSAVSDPQLNKDIKDTVHNVAATSAQGPAIASNAQQITANMAVITDKSKDLPDKISDVASKASKLEEKLSNLVDRVNGIVDKAPKGGNLPIITTEIDLMRQTDPGYWRTDINATIPMHGGFATFGLYDALETNKFNVQLGQTVNPKFDYRYGVYASKPGVGVDYHLNSRLGLRTDLWDINSPEFDARLRYNFGNGLIGWLGADRIFHTTAPTIGIGVER